MKGTNNTSMSNAKRVIITDTSDVIYYEHIVSKILENLEDMDIFREKYNLPKLFQRRNRKFEEFYNCSMESTIKDITIEIPEHHHHHHYSRPRELHWRDLPNIQRINISKIQSL